MIDPHVVRALAHAGRARAAAEILRKVADSLDRGELAVDFPCSTVTMEMFVAPALALVMETATNAEEAAHGYREIARGYTEAANRITKDPSVLPRQDRVG